MKTVELFTVALCGMFILCSCNPVSDVGEADEPSGPEETFDQTPNIIYKDVTVDFNSRKQTILQMGFDLEGYHTSTGSELFTDEMENMLEKIPSTAIRLGMPVKQWETENDNDDPDNIDFDGFSASNTGIQYTFERLAKLKEMGKKIWLGVWDMADWNIVNPSSSNNRNLKNTDELAESITAYLLYAKTNYDVEVDWVSINEPTIASENGWGGYQMGLTAAELASVIKKGMALFEKEGLSTKWLLGSYSLNPSEISQLREVCSDQEILAKLYGLDVHAYGMQKSSNHSKIEEWSEFVSETGLPVFCGECDYDNKFWEREDHDKKIWVTHGMTTAQLYSVMFNDARISASFPWYHNYPSAATPYRYIALHYNSHLKPGYYIVQSQVPVSSMTSVAATDGTDWVVFLQNNSSQQRYVRVNGLQGASAQVYVSYNNNYGIKADDIDVVGGVAELLLKPYSFYSIGNSLQPLEPETVTADANPEVKENLIEAEDGDVGNGSNIDDAQDGYQGNGYVDFGSEGSWNEVEIYIPEAARYLLSAHYATSSDRPCDVYVNGEKISGFSFSPTGGFTTWRDESRTVIFRRGINVIRIQANSSAGGPNVDYYSWAKR